jgi:hypothetical protein
MRSIGARRLGRPRRGGEAMKKMMTLSMTALVLGGTMAVSADAAPRTFLRTLEGTWRMQVTTRDCTSGAPLLSFRAYLTFARGGALTGTTSAPIFRPGQRSSDYGVWQRTGWRQYMTASEAFILFDSPASPPAPALTRGWQRISQEIEIDAADPDLLHSDATVEFRDMAGNLLATGCATAQGNRFQ